MTAVSAADAALLTTLFGPQVAGDDPFRTALEWRFHVETTQGDLSDAVAALVRTVVHSGLGYCPMGWSVETRDGAHALGVLILHTRHLEKEAA